MEKILDFNELLKDFPSDLWDIGWIDDKDLLNLANSPIKIDMNPVFLVDEGQIGIVFIKNTPRYDYSINFETQDWFRARDLFANRREVNDKKAAVLAGKGQQAKNTAFWSYKFGFDVHLQTYIMHDCKVINLPPREKANWKELPWCAGCTDCADACPAHAIHNEEPRNTWIDFHACMNFSHYGDHPTIPSIKYGWRNLYHPEVSDEQLRQIKNADDMNDMFGISDFESVVDLPNGQKLFIQYPVCRECVSQPKCTKYGGKHPYKWEAETY